jgi:hypothetical protein
MAKFIDKLERWAFADKPGRLRLWIRWHLSASNLDWVHRCEQYYGVDLGKYCPVCFGAKFTLNQDYSRNRCDACDATGLFDQWRAQQYGCHHTHEKDK